MTNYRLTQKACSRPLCFAVSIIPWSLVYCSKKDSKGERHGSAAGEWGRRVEEGRKGEREGKEGGWNGGWGRDGGKRGKDARRDLGEGREPTRGLLCKPGLSPCNVM